MTSHPENHVTVVMHTYNRPDYVEQYVAAGHWAGIRLEVTDDGSPEAVVQRLSAACGAQGIPVHHYTPNQGVAVATRVGIERACTPHVMMVGDDDYFEDFFPFVAAAEAVLEAEDTLLVAMPFVDQFNEGGQRARQYDRRDFDGMTGAELLAHLTYYGEMQALQAGSMLRRTDVLGLVADPFFRMSEDYVLLARLCARFPERKVRVLDQGCYMRLVHARSLEVQNRTRPVQLTMNLVSLFVAAKYMLDFGFISRDAFVGVLRQRGRTLQAVYGFGLETSIVLELLLRGESPARGSQEAAICMGYLKRHLAALPAEFAALLPEESLAAIATTEVVMEQARPDTPPLDEAVVEGVRAAILQGQHEAATTLLNNLMVTYPDHEQVLVLQAELLVQQKQDGKALKALENALLLHPESQALLMMLADLVCRYKLYPEAGRLYARAAHGADNQTKAQLDDVWTFLATKGITTPKPSRKLALIASEGLDHFLADIAPAMVLDFEVRKFTVKEPHQVAPIMAWADVCWFEWCDELFVYATQQELAREKTIVCRLHRYEVFTDNPMQVVWEHVDRLIFVTDHIRLLLQNIIPGLEERVQMEVVHNGVDTDKYTLVERAPGFKLAFAGCLFQRKNPMLLLQIMSRLVALDPRYQLYVAGAFKDPVVKLYWKHGIHAFGLQDHIFMDGWQDDMPAWLSDKHYLLSTSIHESFGYTIAEGMACGIKPVVHNFPFAHQIWPEEILFNTVDEAVGQIASGEYDSQLYRQFITKQYGLNKQVRHLRKLLGEVGAGTARPNLYRVEDSEDAWSQARSA